MKKCKCCGNQFNVVLEICRDCYMDFLDSDYTFDDFINSKITQQRSKKIKNILNGKM
jgi:hypothetical protein